MNTYENSNTQILLNQSKSVPYFIPLYIFEAIHLNNYFHDFVQVYARISIKLEIEQLALTQYQREAFSNEEIVNSKRISNLIDQYQKNLEQLWKDSRWIIDMVNCLREKLTSFTQLSTSQPIFMLQISDLKLFCKKFEKRFTFNPSDSSSKIAKIEPMQILENSKVNIYNQITQLPFAKLVSNNRDIKMVDSFTSNKYKRRFFLSNEKLISNSQNNGQKNDQDIKKNNDQFLIENSEKKRHSKSESNLAPFTRSLSNFVSFSSNSSTNSNLVLNNFKKSTSISSFHNQDESFIDRASNLNNLKKKST